jgi:hypothetical protein
MTYELYKGGFLGGQYIDRVIRKISPDRSECRTYVIFVDGKAKQFKGLLDIYSSTFVGYVKPGIAENIIFTECL